MKVRIVVSVIALALVATSLTPVFAGRKSEMTAVCCATQSDCASGETCCTAESLGKFDCALSAPGYCQTVCAPREGNR
jgi:hypothetical protein